LSQELFEDDAGLAARLQHLDTGELAREAREYVGHSRVVNAVGFRPGKNEVASAGEDDEIRFWSIPE